MKKFSQAETVKAQNLWSGVFVSAHVNAMNHVTYTLLHVAEFHSLFYV